MFNQKYPYWIFKKKLSVWMAVYKRKDSGNNTALPNYFFIKPRLVFMQINKK